MFERLRGRHFHTETPATEKNRNPKNVVLSIIRKVFAKKVDINVEIVNKIQDFAQHLALCCNILQLIIVKSKTHIWQYNQVKMSILLHISFL